MTRLLLLVLVPVALGLVSAAPEDPPGRLPVPKSPLSPDAEKATFHLAPGLRIDLIAAEPEIESPVACAFDESGKLWVVEMLDYPNGPPKGSPGQGRIKVLEDRDGDGRFEHATVFADELLFANGLLHWAGGVIVTAAPHVLFLKDTDGDGRADVRTVLYEGFMAGNPQLRVSHPNLGPDGWISVANGLRGGEVRRAGSAEKGIPLGGKDFRFDPVNDRFEAIPGMGQFGNTFDRWGRRFVCDNRNHLRHAVFPTDPGRRNPHLITPLLMQDTCDDPHGPLSSGAKIYPLSRNWTTSNLHAGRFTASCGVYAEKGGLLPPPYAGGVFTCDPTGNLVHMESLIPDGASFRSKPWKEGVEFLASPDEWFRPVFLTQDPSGALVLVDMYRAVIEHPEFMPVELRTRPDLLLGKERGRIWRIAPESGKPGGRSPDLGKRPPAELVRLLGHEDGWHRSTAQRLLLASRDPAANETLKAYARDTKSPEGLILSAWLLNARGQGPGDEVLLRMRSSGHPRVREQAAQLVEAVGKPELAAELAADDDARVRFQAALSIGAWDDAKRVPVLARLGIRDSGDRWTRIAIASSAGDRAADLVVELLHHPEFTASPADGRVQLVRELAQLVGSGRDPARVGPVLDALSGQKIEWQRATLAGLAGGLARRGTSFPAFLAKLPGQRENATKLLANATGSAGVQRAGEADRLAAIELLAHAPWELAGPVLTDLVRSGETPTPIRLAAVRSLAAHPRPEVTAALLDGWRSYTPSVQSEVLETLIRSPARAAALLDAIEAKTVRSTDVDPARARRLIALKDRKVADRARHLLRDRLPADRSEVLAKYRPALTLPADPLRGREVFKKQCAGCHVIEGVGTQVGPDISDTRTKTPEMLLTDILNPNAAIDGNYISYTVTTLDGKSFLGVIASESAAGITLRREQNQTDTILRSEIEELRSSGQSLMPEGVEKNITVQEMADLIRYLKDWRYLDGAVPRGK